MHSLIFLHYVNKTPLHSVFGMPFYVSKSLSRVYCLLYALYLQESNIENISFEGVKSHWKSLHEKLKSKSEKA